MILWHRRSFTAVYYARQLEGTANVLVRQQLQRDQPLVGTHWIHTTFCWNGVTDSAQRNTPASMLF